jgi:hypothetical protein
MGRLYGNFPTEASPLQTLCGGILGVTHEARGAAIAAPCACLGFKSQMSVASMSVDGRLSEGVWLKDESFHFGREITA